MKIHFAVVFVTTSAVLATLSGGAWARSGHHAKPAPTPAVNHDEAANRDENVAWVGESGVASYYGPAHQGRRAASGIRFDQKLLTAAHPWLPFGTKVKVTLISTGQSVIVTITDRLYSSHRVVDLSLAAARALGMIRSGIAQVSLLPV